MENPFEVIARRLSNIEELLIDIKHRPASSLISSTNIPKRIDFPTLMREYYNGIPESTVRQDTAHLNRFKIGKRILLDRDEVEEHVKSKRRVSSSEIERNADTQFINHHRSRGGRKAA